MQPWFGSGGTTAWAVGLRDRHARFLRQPLDRVGEAYTLGEHDELEYVTVLARGEVEPGALVVVDEEGGRPAPA